MRYLSVLFGGFWVAGASISAAALDAGSVAKSISTARLGFERNAGQFGDSSADWLATGKGNRVALNSAGAEVVSGTAGTVRMRFVNARSDAAGTALEPLPGKSNYLIGRDSKRWLQNLPTYGRIEYRNVYDGIDVVWYGNQGQLENDFAVKPGADPSRIRMRIDGARRLSLDAAGDVRVETESGEMKLRLPAVYQEIGGARKRVQGHYALLAANEIGFHLARYDKSRQLVIDPTLIYGSYFGGEGLGANAITTDSNGNVYIGGSNRSGLPLLHPLQAPVGSGPSAWVAKFDPSGTTLLYSTWYGGSGYETLYSLAATSTGELIGVGSTNSVDLPLVHASQNQGPPTGYAFSVSFAFRLNASGSGLVYSTYLGGVPPFGSTATSAVTDSAGDAYIAGEADGGFATTNGVYQTAYQGGFSDGFVMKLDPTGAVVYSTMLGSGGLDYLNGIAVDSSGAAYVAGLTGSSSFPGNPPGAVTSNAGGFDAFIAKLSADGSTLVWLTYLGGSGNDVPNYSNCLTRDPATGILYLVGSTTSSDFPTTSGVIDPTSLGSRQGFVASVNPDGMSYGFVTYLGGHRDDGVAGIAFTSSGLAVTGTATSPDFPVANAVEPGFIASRSAAYSSTDSGQDWGSADAGLPGQVIGFSIDPATSSTMLAAAGTRFSWFRTTNGGASWTHADFPALGPWYHLAGAQFAWTAANTDEVYVSYPFSTAQGPGHFSNFNAFGSVDGGVTWGALSVPPAGSSDFLSGFAVSASDANAVLEVAAGGTVFRSGDGGATFTQVSTIAPASWASSETIAVSPADGSVYVAAQQNVYKSTDFGTTWTPAPGIPDWQGMGPIAISPSNPSVLYAGSAWTGNVYKTTDAGTTWHLMTSPGLPLGNQSLLQVAPSNPNVVYATGGGQIAESTDGGATWNSATNPGKSQPIWALAVSPTDPTSVFAAVGAASNNGFVAKLAADGKTLPWSTFYSGEKGSLLNGISALSSGDVWVTGATSSQYQPLTANASATVSHDGAAVLARFSDATAACSYLLNPTTTIAYQLGSGSLSVTAPSGCAWTAVPSDTSWLTVQTPSGVGSGIINGSTTAPNNTGATRTGTINVNGQLFTVIQPDSSCTYALDTSSVNISAAGGNVVIHVTAGAGCPWDVTTVNSLMSVVSGASGTGNGTVTLSIPPNTGTAAVSYLAQIAAAPLVSIQQSDVCIYSMSPLTAGPAASVPSMPGAIAVTASLQGCNGSATSDQSWLTFPKPAVTGSGTINYSVAANPSGTPRTAHITFDNQQFTFTQAGAATRFVPITPCRAVDTRNPVASLGGPSISGGTSRDFPIAGNACGIPTNAQAYSLNAAIIPTSHGYMTMWPAGQAQPGTASVNSPDGGVHSSGSIVPAGLGGAISVFAFDTMDVVLDINGYFVPASTPAALAFYPVTPCRVVDTRNVTGPLGGPFVSGGSTRNLPIANAATACNFSASAQAYSLNVAVVPRTSTFHYLTAWPGGQSQPSVATLNDPQDINHSNGAIVPAGGDGSINVYVTNDADVVLDINGYFALPASGGLSLYTLQPCRALDTRNPPGTPFTGTLAVAVGGSSCSPPSSAQAYVFNATVVPQTGSHGYLTLWEDGAPQPTAANLNSPNGATTGNMALVPTTNGSIDAFFLGTGDLVLDLFGYFAP